VASSADGSDTLTSTERLHFSDVNVALDIAGDAGTVAKLLGAVFGAAAVSNESYVGIGLVYADAGWSDASLSQLALDARFGGAVSHTALVNTLYTNVVGMAPDAGALGYYVAQLDSGAQTETGLTLMAAQTDLNAAHIGLTGLAAAGLEYI
jgi:hypothetical protein